MSVDPKFQENDIEVSTNNYTLKTAPYDHQLRIWERSRDEKNWAIIAEMGTGKSWVAINTFGWLFQRQLIDAVVYIAKAGEYLNFSQYEIPNHLPDHVRREVHEYSSATRSRDARAMRSLMRVDPSRLPILVINAEAVLKGGGDVLDDLYRAHRRVMIIVDESTLIKNWESKRSQKIYTYCHRSVYRRIMTGTLITRSPPQDVYGQYLAFGKNVFGFTSYYAFRNYYCEMELLYLGQRAVKVVGGYRNLEELSSNIMRTASQVLKEDCLDLPPKVYTQRVVPLSPELRKKYETLKQQALLQLEGREDIEVVSVLAQITKLHQLVCGQIKYGENDYESVPNDRLPALVDVVEDYGKKTIVWATYRQTLRDVASTLRKKFGERSVVEYHGEVPVKDRRNSLLRFRGWAPIVENGVRVGTETCPPKDQAQFFVAHPQSAGYGISLTEAELVVYYSNGYNLEHRLQSEDRCHRIGQTKSVTYVDLISPDTVDDRIVHLLRSKKNLADEVLRRPVREWL